MGSAVEQLPNYTVIRDVNNAVIFDDRVPGFVFTTWFGEATVPLVDRYYERHASHLADLRKEKRRFVLITDTFAAARPSPNARKRIADLLVTLGPDRRYLTVGSYLVIESALIRGAVTALAWLDASLAETVSVPNVDVAIERGLVDLRNAGQAVPPNFPTAKYRRPARP